MIVLDPTEQLEMNAAACPNKKCNAYLNVQSLPCAEPFKCEKCHTIITHDFVENFHDTMEFTKTHVENMKDIAC